MTDFRIKINPCPVADVENSDVSYATTVVSGGTLVLPDQEIQNNGVASGFIPSVGTINVTTNAVPTSFTITGRTIDIVVPSGGGSYDIDTTDRFGNVLPTIIVSANSTLNWNSYDFADLYLSRLVNPPTGAQLTAVYTFFDDLITAGIFQKATAIYPIIGGTSDDHKWNARYPFNNRNSNALEYLGSPTHNANGISTNGTTQLVRTAIIPKSLTNNKQMSVYKRNQNASGISGIAFGSNVFSQGFSFYPRFTDNNQYMSNESPTFLGTTGGTIIASQTDGLLSIRRDGSNVSIVRRAVVAATSSITKTVDHHMELCIGGSLSPIVVIENSTAVDFSYCYVGEYLTNTQETDHNNIVTALQTSLSRNV